MCCLNFVIDYGNFSFSFFVDTFIIRRGATKNLLNALFVLVFYSIFILSLLTHAAEPLLPSAPVVMSNTKAAQLIGAQLI